MLADALQILRQTPEGWHCILAYLGMQDRKARLPCGRDKRLDVLLSHIGCLKGDIIRVH